MPEVLLLVAVISCFGTLRYREFARRRNIVAQANFRSLHEKIIPRGGGIIFAGIFSLAIVAFGVAGMVSFRVVLAIGLGGGGAALAGFIDDIYDVRPTRKLLIQIGLSVWAFAVLYPSEYTLVLRNQSGVLAVFFGGFLLFIPVWLINLYNFIDGIDGLAVSGGIFIAGAAMIVLKLTGGDSDLTLALSLLIASSLGFLFFNLPPASLFMGDAGSIFFGYCFATFAMMSTIEGRMSAWTWLAIMGYFIADTTTTTAVRFLVVPRWYGVHRSHAYQNLARIHMSHGKVTYGVMVYNVVWALPLAIWSALRPEWAAFAAVLSISPAVLWTLRFGPLLSNA